MIDCLDWMAPRQGRVGRAGRYPTLGFEDNHLGRRTPVVSTPHRLRDDRRAYKKYTIHVSTHISCVSPDLSTPVLLGFCFGSDAWTGQDSAEFRGCYIGQPANVYRMHTGHIEKNRTSFSENIPIGIQSVNTEYHSIHIRPC